MLWDVESLKIITTVVPRSYATPVKLFSQQRYFELGPKKLELSYFSPQLHYFLA